MPWIQVLVPHQCLSCGYGSMSDIGKANRSRQHTARHDNILNCLIGHREGRGTASAAVPSDVICSTSQHTLTPTRMSYKDMILELRELTESFDEVGFTDAEIMEYVREGERLVR